MNNNTPPVDAAGVVARLRASAVVRPGEPITLEVDGVVYSGTTGEIVQQRNPDGPEAADLIEALLAALERQRDRIADLELALDLALAWLGEQEPGDSRAVSNEFVAMASIRCEATRLNECRNIIRLALAQPGGKS
jgi:hypothetical protein